MFVTSRDRERAEATAREVGGSCRGLSLDLSNPHGIEAALAGVDDVEHLALVAVDRDENNLREYNIDSALNLITLKLVGYTEAIHVLAPRMRPQRFHRALRRARQGPSVSRVDHRVDRQRRGVDDGPYAGARADASPGERHPSGRGRRQPVLAEQAGGGARRVAQADAVRVS